MFVVPDFDNSTCDMNAHAFHEKIGCLTCFGIFTQESEIERSLEARNSNTIL